ncbi:hypothetical protein SO802_010739 [Lithocarpus litseifolius]|uniref:DDE Tnp4 domain-containing protein n=1 Tax=Lithocarpus litseifolius TaxID=425828 RepID=A0AAW2DFJ9_9ROSI
MELMFMHLFQFNYKEGKYYLGDFGYGVRKGIISPYRGVRYHLEEFYLGDVGYGVRKGIISPYRGVRYHLKEFSDNPPRNDKELFNLRHSSLRTSIERCFGVLKKRFHVLDAEPFWLFPIQVDVALACCIIHNHIIGVDPLDSIMSNGLHGSPLANESRSRRVQQSQRDVQEENREWVLKWDDICCKMWEDYNAME